MCTLGRAVLGLDSMAFGRWEQVQPTISCSACIRHASMSASAKSRQHARRSMNVSGSWAALYLSPCQVGTICTEFNNTESGMERLESRASKEAAWRSRLQRHAQSGKSVAAFCRDESVSTASYHLWRTKLEVVDEDMPDPDPRPGICSRSSTAGRPRSACCILIAMACACGQSVWNRGVS